jgi:hypothetical protein
MDEPIHQHLLQEGPEQLVRQLASVQVDLAQRPDLRDLLARVELAREDERGRVVVDGLWHHDALELREVRAQDVRISKAFSRFDAEPLAAASLGQIHPSSLQRISSTSANENGATSSCRRASASRNGWGSSRVARWPEGVVTTESQE